jgi:hypothetical protein
MGRMVLMVLVALLWLCAVPAQPEEPVLAPPPGASMPAPGPAPSVPETPPPSARYAFDPGERSASEDTSIEVDTEPQAVPEARVRFVCDIQSDAFLRDGWVRMRVTNQKGEIIEESRLDFPVAPGASQCQFVWDAEKMPLGVYTARFDVMRGDRYEECHAQVLVSKLTEPFLADRLASISNECEQLRGFVEDLAKAGQSVAYAQIRLAIADDVAARGRESLARGDWLRANYYSNYVADTLSSVRARLALSKELSEVFGPVPAPSLARVERRDGGFYAQGRPVFLLGGYGGEELIGDLPRLSRYGLNHAAFDMAPGVFSASEALPAEVYQGIKSAFDVAERLNISVTYLLSPFRASDWARSNTPGLTPAAEGVLDMSGDARDFIERYLRASASAVGGEPMLNSLAIAQRPAFNFEGPSVRAGFIARLREIYPDVDILNRVWKSRFVDMEDVTVVWDPARRDYHERAAFQYDWQTYHQWLGTEFLAWMNDTILSVNPSIPTYVVSDDNLFEPGESIRGVDSEALAGFLELTAVAVDSSPNDPVYAMRYPQSSVHYALMKSFAPDKPLINPQHVLLEPGDPFGRFSYGYVHSALWEAAMCGLNGSALAPWGREGTGLQGRILDRPECLEAYATACLDLNRLADVVMAFQRAPAPVAILWSMPARIYNKGTEYLGSVQRAYEGLSFGGHRVRFITEDQIAANGLEGVEVLVIPQLSAMGNELGDDKAFRAVQAFMAAGGVVIKTGSPIPFDARGRSRRDILVPTLQTLLVRGTDTSTGYLDALDAAYANGGLTPVPRAINEHGYPLEGVRTLFVQHQDRPYLFVLNLRKEPVKVYLHGPYSEGRDLIAGRTVEFPGIVEPLEPMLLQLKPVEPSEYIPTATVGEEPPDPPSILRPLEKAGSPRRR